eukprot:26755_1
MAIKKQILSPTQQKLLWVGLTIGALLSCFPYYVPNVSEREAAHALIELQSVSNSSIDTPLDTILTSHTQKVDLERKATSMKIQAVSNSSTDTKRNVTQSIHELSIAIGSPYTHRAYPSIWVDKRHKLLYCYIPKNACTKFKILFFAMINRFPPSTMYQQMMKTHIHKVNSKYSANKKFLATKILDDRRWRTLLVVRDPLERLLSGFLNKCINAASCGGSKLTRDQFKVFVQRVDHGIRTDTKIGMWNHFWPQHIFCGLPFIYPQFVDFTIYYDTYMIGERTLRFLQDVHLEHYYYHWGRYGNETLFDSFTYHSTKQGIRSFNDSVSFYQEFYDKKLVEMVMIMFQKDYELFNLTKPLWTEYIQ